MESTKSKQRIIFNLKWCKKMGILTLVKRDLYTSTSWYGYRISLFFIINLLVSFLLSMRFSGDFSIGDLILIFWQISSPKQGFNLLAFFHPILILITIGSYIYDDFKNSSFVLVRLQNRKYFWFAKCTWSFISIMALNFLSIIAWCLGSYNKLKFSFVLISQYTKENITSYLQIKITDIELIYTTIILYLLGLICISLIQMYISLFLESIYIFIINIIMLGCAQFTSWIISPSVHIAITKHSIFKNNYLEIEQSIVFFIIIIFFIVIFGIKTLNTKDIL
ncbi:hypothetical protein [Bacillus nitratireducens]|uniref:ABC-2 family transporter protein n=1 Tax=Bacillus nitratireducens TaxID=2026193 RepID=A0ABU6P4P6_9BACI|nr:hypothetical protein [Bacillus nitratireducens]MED4676282.1 hypothetical protein [Bacillus nitratireducens]